MKTEPGKKEEEIIALIPGKYLDNHAGKRQAICGSERNPQHTEYD
jgi:hypothetical protein